MNGWVNVCVCVCVCVVPDCEVRRLCAGPAGAGATEGAPSAHRAHPPVRVARPHLALAALDRLPALPGQWRGTGAGQCDVTGQVSVMYGAGPAV